jgi:hypothetical protein
LGKKETYWELEQEKEWTKVLSKATKKGAARKATQTNVQHKKRVRFAENLVQSPPQPHQHNLVSLVSVRSVWR